MNIKKQPPTQHDVGEVLFSTRKNTFRKTRCCKVRAKGWPFIWRPQWEAWKSNQPGDLGCRHERPWKVFGHFWEASFPGKVEATKKDLGGGNSSFFKCSSLLGVSWSNLTIQYFSDGLVQPTTNKKRSMFCCFYCPFFCAPKNRTFGERGNLGPRTPGWKTSTGQGERWRKLLEATDGGGMGCFEGEFPGSCCAFFSNLPFKTQDS